MLRTACDECIHHLNCMCAATEITEFCCRGCPPLVKALCPLPSCSSTSATRWDGQAPSVSRDADPAARLPSPLPRISIQVPIGSVAAPPANPCSKAGHGPVRRHHGYQQPTAHRVGVAEVRVGEGPSQDAGECCRQCCAGRGDGSTPGDAQLATAPSACLAHLRSTGKPPHPVPQDNLA